MLKQKLEKWQRDLTLLRFELNDLRSFRLYCSIVNRALNGHPLLVEDGGVLTQHFMTLQHVAAAVHVRRLVKRHDDAASLTWLLDDLLKWYKMGAECFPNICAESELRKDSLRLEEATRAVVAFVDQAYVHVDRKPRGPIYEGITGVMAAVDATLDIGTKYVNLIGEGMPDEFPMRDSDVIDLFGVPWIDADDMPGFLAWVISGANA